MYLFFLIAQSEESVLCVGSEVHRGTSAIISALKAFQRFSLTIVSGLQNYYVQPISDDCADVLISQKLETGIGSYISTYVLKNIGEENRFSIVSQLMHKID